MLKSSHRQVDIVFTKSGICTLIYIVIANPTHVDLLPQSRIIQRFATSNVTQVKERSYHNQHPINQFIFLAIEYLDVYTNKLICSYTIISMSFGASKGEKALPFLSWLLSFIKNLNYTTKDAIILLTWAIIVNLDTS